MQKRGLYSIVSVVVIASLILGSSPSNAFSAPAEKENKEIIVKYLNNSEFETEKT